MSPDFPHGPEQPLGRPRRVGHGQDVSATKVDVGVSDFILMSSSADLQQMIAMAYRDDETGWDLWTLSTESWKAAPWLATPALEVYPRLSPDGR